MDRVDTYVIGGGMANTFLVAKGMNANRLDTVGYGSERLLVPDRPEDPTNRRVEIRDLGNASQ